MTPDLETKLELLNNRR